ncbi:MAG: hypothetical protein A2286_03995 [Gammaproteobacteria bacterium RIFOXYA12_FULL_61_12]|nr:MAG: hypothetical protein A2514_14500 [Gammaproteobacteria bacterium RIFOXYD12_FULL_61_37]OGT94460.1 MAG: hypothetical protein A2286_03995 [Gammaproteobacteria bacterium RIFOXYA12_FULL_61_12]
MLTAGSAAHFGTAWHDGSIQAGSRLDQARQDLERQNAALQTAISLEADDADSPRDSGNVLSAVLLGLKAAGVAHGVKHGQITLSGPGSSQQDATVDGLFQPLSSTGGRVLSASISLKGQYQDYASFRRYLAAIVELPASVRKLSVNGRSYDLDIRVYAIR